MTIIYIYFLHIIGPACWGHTTHRLHFCRGVRFPHVCSGYDTKQSDGEAPGMKSTPLLLLLPGPL